MAQIAGPNIVEATPTRTCAKVTGQNEGNAAMSNEPAARIASATAIRVLFACSLSTRAPEGAWARMPAMPPTVRTVPTFCWFHPLSAR
jgi:hypothetical protein